MTTKLTCPACGLILLPDIDDKLRYWCPNLECLKSGIRIEQKSRREGIHLPLWIDVDEILDDE